MSGNIKNKINPLHLVLVFFIMLGLSYASVPLYEAFCKLTGFGGTPKSSKEIPKNVINHKVTTRFDTNVGKGLFWDFKPDKNQQSIRAGEVSIVKFTVKNLENKETTGVSTFNITPDQAAKYFNKIECFCFEQQTLKAKETKVFEMAYFIDPKIVDDLSAKEIKDITLSYTFFDVANFKKEKK